MLSRDLLVDAAEACVNTGFGHPQLIQRKVRVGFATAAQILIALCDVGILGAGSNGRWPARRVRAGRGPLETEIDAAIADGLITLTPPDGQVWPPPERIESS